MVLLQSLTVSLVDLSVSSQPFFFLVSSLVFALPADKVGAGGWVGLRTGPQQRRGT